MLPVYVLIQSIEITHNKHQDEDGSGIGSKHFFFWSHYEKGKKTGKRDSESQCEKILCSLSLWHGQISMHSVEILCGESSLLPMQANNAI